MGKIIDLKGKKFNKLSVIEFAYTKKQPSGKSVAFWKCLCDCGNISYVSATHLKSNHTTSCGCALKQHQKNLGEYNYANGLSNTRIGRIYYNMINRCKNPNVSSYKYYGAMQIKVCEKWQPKNNGFKNFCDWAFQNGYNENLTIDRIDNNGNYEPNNCRWVDLYIQANNKKKTKRYEYKGEKLTIAEISRKYNIGYFLLHSRVERLGWDIVEAVETPIVLGRNQYSK